MTNEIPRQIAESVEAARDKKGEDVVVLDLRGTSDVTDYFIICHGNSDRHVQSIVDGIEERLRERLGLKAKHVEGLRPADWVLMDYIDFVVHVFLEAKRDFYRLERLWGDAPQLELSDPSPPSRDADASA